jgi:HAD superfamily hydrolase (TIGR01450 family)
MDGVLHQFGKAVPGAAEFLGTLAEESIPFTVITNECRYSREGLSEKLADVLGVSVPVGQIYTAANSVGDFLAEHIRRGWVGNVFVIGEAGVFKAVEAALEHCPGAQVFRGAAGEEQGSHCDFVVVGTVATGGQNDSWTFAEAACTHLRNGAKLLYSNPDWFEVTAAGEYKFGCPMPTVNLLTQVTGCRAYNLGKPNPSMLRRAQSQLVDSILQPLSESQRNFVRGQIDPNDVLFVGDSIDTDLRMAVENGIDAALVLSGTTTLRGLSSCAIQPHFVFDSIGHLHTAFQDGTLQKGTPNFRIQASRAA